MKNSLTLAGFAAAIALLTTSLVGAQNTQGQQMSFFITSVGSGNGANLGGIAGADKHCQMLAEKAGSKGRTWAAYLSAGGIGGGKAVNARDRIGSGPWYNAKGTMVAQNVAELHSEAAKTGKEGSLNERGETVNGRGDTPNRHDILTGSQQDGTLAKGDQSMTCMDWTSSTEGMAMVGHHDRQGGGANPNSWNSAHPSKGCAQDVLRGTGGDGLFYCFATK